MPPYLITSLYDEGISPNLFRLVQAHPNRWQYFLHRAFSEDLSLGILTPEALLERIEHTHVDGDSSAQLRISPVTVQTLNEIDTDPSFRPGAMFSDFG